MSDKEYNEAVERLIPIAAAYADKKVPEGKELTTLQKNKYRDEWSKVYLDKMEALRKVEGIGIYKNEKNIRVVSIGIDPDLKKSGFAVWHKRIKTLELSVENFFDATVMIHSYHEAPNVKLIVFIEAGWLNKKSNYRPGLTPAVRENIAKKVGQNHAVGQLFVEFCEINEINFRTVKPTMSKIDAKTFNRITGYKGFSNQEKRDAGMLAIKG